MQITPGSLHTFCKLSAWQYSKYDNVLKSVVGKGLCMDVPGVFYIVVSIQPHNDFDSALYLLTDKRIAWFLDYCGAVEGGKILCE